MRFKLVPLGTFGNCPVGVARAPGYTNLDLMFSKRVDIQGAALRRVQDRGLQRVESPELRTAGAGHLGAEHVRHHYQHHQLAAGRRAGVEVLFLSEGRHVGQGACENRCQRGSPMSRIRAWYRGSDAIVLNGGYGASARIRPPGPDTRARTPRAPAPSHRARRRSAPGRTLTRTAAWREPRALSGFCGRRAAGPPPRRHTPDRPRIVSFPTTT